MYNGRIGQCLLLYGSRRANWIRSALTMTSPRGRGAPESTLSGSHTSWVHRRVAKAVGWAGGAPRHTVEGREIP